MLVAPPEESLREENAWLASRLHEMGELLRKQGANPYRAAAYEHAAQSVAHWPQPVRTLFSQRGRGGLMTIPGVGEGISSALAEMIITGAWAQLARLKEAAQAEEEAPTAEPAPGLPDVATLLSVDREYRAAVMVGSLAKGVLHTARGEWHFTASGSGRPDDYVVISFYDGDTREHRCTVVTESRGLLKGKRVVRGREHEARTRAPAREPLPA